MTARDIAALFDALELDLVKSLHRCLARHHKQEQTEGGKNGVPQHWEAWQAAKLRDIRRFRRENTAILGEYRDRIDAGTRALLEEEAAQGGTDEFFRMDDTRMNALLNEMQQANEQSERAALRYMNDVYRKTILRTAAAMQAGGQTLQQATDAATRDFLDQGIACIRYRNGRRVNISTYAEMALRTAGTRAMLMGEAAQRERLGLDTVLVSQYGACSKTCLPWQGLVYIDDVFQPYHGPRTPGGTYGVSRSGRQYPLLSAAMQGGLFHPNCRHTLSTWVEGVSTRPRPMDKAKVEAAAQLEAKQRALERSVRKAQRQAAGLCDPAAAKSARARVRAAQKELRDFVADHGDVLRRNVWRERDTAALERYTNPAASGILDTSNRIGVNPDVNYICDLNPEIYKAAVPTITTEHVIITDKQLEHIRERHPDISATVMEQLTEIIHAPDYIIETDMPYTANILKHLEINGKGYQLVLRIRTDSDPEEFQNSVITFMSVNEKRYRQYLRNRKILYSRE